MFGQPKGRKLPHQNKAKNIAIYCVVVAALMVVALISGRLRQQERAAVRQSDAPFQIHVIDVGQGDSILVLADGHSMLIDYGNSNAGNTVLSYLEILGINHLDYAVTTHYHFDHVGGFAAVAKSCTFDKVIEPPCPENLIPTDQPYKMYLNATTGDKAPEKQTMQAGDTFTLGKAQIEVLAPADAQASDLNNTSLVLRLQYEDTVCLFTGDMTEEEEEKLLATDADLDADFLKVAHHGSKYGTSEAFLQRVTPEFAAVSCAKENDYGHPAPETITRLEASGKTQVGITAQQGHLVYLYENGKLVYYPQKSEVQK